MKPAIVISAYNRPHALERLLASLARAHYLELEAIPLVISIDNAGSCPEVIEAARKLHWPYGPKEMILHNEHLGPIGHFYACGDLTATYGAIIFLEDDLVVSPVFYDYCNQALSYFGEDERIGGFSLYSLWFNGYTQEPFVPLADKADVFFVQVPYTQGQAFTRDQWSKFRSWLAKGEKDGFTPLNLHKAWDRFRQDEWFPILAKYLVSTGRYDVFPRVSQTTGFGDAGTHFSRPTGFFQAPLQREKTSYTFKPFDDSLSVYDSFFEILPDRLARLAPMLQGYDYMVDLYGGRARENIRSEYILTSRPCRQSIHSFGRAMWPHEVNIEQNVPGEDICFAKVEDLRWDPIAEAMLHQSNDDYFWRGRRRGRRQELVFGMLRVWRGLSRFFSRAAEEIRKLSIKLRFWQRA